MSDSHFNGPLAEMLQSRFRSFDDPWSAEENASVQSPDAEPLCLNCLFPQGPDARFCANCGQTVGDFVPLNPYLQIFTLGEVVRRGVAGPPEHRLGVQAFLAVFAVAQYSVFAPAYWYWMFRRAKGRPICYETRREVPAETEI